MDACSCWLDRTAFYYAFALPVGVVILVNSILFGLIIKGITCDRTKGIQSTQARGELTMLQLQAGIASFVILGWLLALPLSFFLSHLYVRARLYITDMTGIGGMRFNWRYFLMNGMCWHVRLKITVALIFIIYLYTILDQRCLYSIDQVEYGSHDQLHIYPLCEMFTSPDIDTT